MEKDAVTSAKLATATVVKNAGYKLAEWIAFQKAIGFDAVLLLDNGSTDDTAKIARAFSNYFDVRIEAWADTSPMYQKRGYDHLLGTVASEFDWCACIDSDEFLILPEGKTLKGLVDLPDDVSAIAMPWAFFGSSGHETPPDDLVIKSFTKRADVGFGPNTIIKTMIRVRDFTECDNVHRFIVPGSYVDMAHNRIQVLYHDMPNPDFSAGKLHHYFVQSRHDWAAKISRGYHDTTRSAAEFEVYDRNEVEDRSALQYADKVENILAEVFGDARPRHGFPLSTTAPKSAITKFFMTGIRQFRR